MEEGFKNSIAPDHLFLPNIMTKYTPDERQLLIERVKQKIVNNKWTGKQKTRPTIQLTTTKTREQFAFGTRKQSTRIIKGVTYTQQPQSGVPVAHIVLLMNGFYPTEDDQASHLCHNAFCVKADHLLWERADKNMRRLRCQRQKVCNCRLQPACLMKCD